MKQKTDTEGFMERNFLLVGGDGFIGTNLKNEMVARGMQIKSIDRKDGDFSNSIDVMVDYMKDSTHVLFLASELGAKLFNNSPLEPFVNNMKLINNFCCAVSHVFSQYNRKLDVSWFSSSEIFNSTDSKTVITNDTYAKLDLCNCRTMYSVAKVTGELLFTDMYNNHMINSLNIFRLFNVSGKNQRRGVLFEMIHSAVTNNSIEYSDETTRTITSARYAVDEMLKIINTNTDGVVSANIAEDRNSMYMKDLAMIVKDTLECCGICKNIKMIKNPPDKYIQYRHTEVPDRNRIDEYTIRKCISDILGDLK